MHDSHGHFLRRPLGKLQYLRVWHDNSGRGNYASWYMTAAVVRDIQTNEKFEFICNRWLAVEKDDGRVRNEKLMSRKTSQCAYNFLPD